MVGDIKILPVVYMGGTCGDLISSLIDPRGTNIDMVWRCVKIPPERQRLKKPYTFRDNLEKDIYLDNMSNLYTSIPSHDLEYHIARGHRFVGIRVRDFNIALWAARHFRDVHRPEVWQSIQQSYNITMLEQYAQLIIDYGNMVSQYTSELLELEDIVSGHVLPSLEYIIGRNLGKHAVNYYRNWKDIQNGSFFI